MRRPETAEPITATELYASLDLHGDRRRASRSTALKRLWVLTSVLAIVAFGAGVSLDATVLHIGPHAHSTSVVIGQKVIREDPPARTVPRPPGPDPSPSLSWASPVVADPSAPLRSISCTSSTFCVAVDEQGQAVVYAGGRWSAPQRIDAGNQINSVSCTSASWCAAVDQAGNALFYEGNGWTSPQRVDTSEFPELTSVSCSSPAFCAAVDGRGNGLVYDGSRWSAPEQVDPAGWGRVSRDVPSVSCPSDGSCVGVDPENNAFFYQSGSWQPAAGINSGAGTPAIKSPNAVSCGSATFCVATDNLGNIEAYNGTQWSLPVAVDSANYLAAISCPTASFCAGVDSLLPAGFNSGSGEGNGQVVTYDGIAWSAPRQIDPSVLVSSISCASAQFCAAVDGAGQAVIGTAPSARRR